MADTSWEKSSKWYNGIVGESGQYYHQKIVIPGVVKLLNIKQGESLLDLGCGQGILGRQANWDEYMGLDASPSLIEFARKMDKSLGHVYKYADVTKKLPINKFDYDKAAIILALQNMANSKAVILNASTHLKSGGTLAIVLNHPSFRIPKQSGWGVDREKMIQYRWIMSYMSTEKTEITTNPGDKNSEVTWSFHKPLSAYSKELYDAGMVIEQIEEWISDRKSTGSMAAAEDKARAEIPLFMAIVARKI